MIDVSTLKSKTNLIALAERDTTLRRKTANEYTGPCPFCGGRDRFNVQADKWLCRHDCTQGKWQDVIAYIMRRESCDFRSACELLGTLDPLPYRARAIAPAPEPSEPSLVWQFQAKQVIAQAVETIWSEQGTKAREYLHNRGLNDDSIRKWRLGYLPGAPSEWRKVNELSVPCGITIPCEIADVLWYVKVRRAHAEPKYEQIAGIKSDKTHGGHAALFGADRMTGKSTAIVCEGEFDAMLLYQEIGDLVGVCTMGGEATLPSDAMMRYLLPCASWLIALDVDGKSEGGVKRWLQKSQRARRVFIPKIAEHVKDVSDYHNAGGDLRAWVMFQLGANEMSKQKSNGEIIAELWAKSESLLDKAATFANDNPQIDAVLAEWRKVDDELRARVDGQAVTQAILQNA